MKDPSRDFSRGVRYPVIDNYEPVWVAGKDKPDHYRDDRGNRRDTPDYDTWRGDWGRADL